MKNCEEEITDDLPRPRFRGICAIHGHGKRQQFRHYHRTRCWPAAWQGISTVIVLKSNDHIKKSIASINEHVNHQYDLRAFFCAQFLKICRN